MVLILLGIFAYRTFFPSTPPSPADNFQLITNTPPASDTSKSPATTTQPNPETELITTPTETLADALSTLTPPSDTTTPAGGPAAHETEPVGTVKASGGIILAAPGDGVRVTSPISISGKTKLSGKIFFRVTSLAGSVLIQESANLKGSLDAEGYRPYQIKIGYDFSSTREGYVEAYSVTASGSEENLARARVFFD